MTEAEPTVSEFTVKPLGPDTWEAFAELVERHNGVWGGCWCTWFHPARAEKGQGTEDNRAFKKRLVSEGRAHAALVFDGDVAVAWCQYGTPEELPNIYHRKEYEVGLDRLPDYRITCFFVDRKYRRGGAAAVALRGALGSDRASGRWCRGGVSTGHAGQENFGLLPLQRHAQALREGWLQLRTVQGKEPLRDAQDGLMQLVSRE